jgi:hypothetical protein
MIHRLIVPLTFAAVALHASQALAQGAFPASSPLGSTADVCKNEFAPLRDEAEARGKLIKAASERHAPPKEACRLIDNFGQAEVKMIKYIEANATRCGIPAQVGDQLKAGHKNTEAMRTKVCVVAQQAQSRDPASPGFGGTLGPAGPVGDFDQIR